MKTEHTKGPWEIETKGSRHFIDGADQLTVAYVDRAGVRDRQEIEANARLIAAAPDLLSELHSVRVQLEAQSLGYSASEIWPHVRTEIVRRISDAISKVEGNA